jgi:hypothetical protein
LHLFRVIKYHETLSEKQVERIRKDLIKTHHFFLRKNVLTEKEYRSKELIDKQKWKIYERKIRSMGIENLAKILATMARLTQVKIYLIWSRDEASRLKQR